MKFDDPRGAQWKEIGGLPSVHDPELIRIIIGESSFLLAVVRVNTIGHDLALPHSIDVMCVVSQIVNIEDTIAQECANVQLQRSLEVPESLERELKELSLDIRALCSLEVRIIRETNLTRARAGISICGYSPSRETGMFWSVKLQGDNFNLRRGFAWKTPMVQLCQVEGDPSGGNGRTWTNRRFRELVVIPVGFEDDYSDTLGSCGTGLLKGRSASYVGRVGMVIRTLVGIGSPGVSVNDDEIWVDELASSSETIDYVFPFRPSPVATQAFV